MTEKMESIREGMGTPSVHDQLKKLATSIQKEIENTPPRNWVNEVLIPKNFDDNARRQRGGLEIKEIQGNTPNSLGFSVSSWKNMSTVTLRKNQGNQVSINIDGIDLSDYFKVTDWPVRESHMRKIIEHLNLLNAVKNTPKNPDGEYNMNAVPVDYANFILSLGPTTR